jgi:hypothetical protein
MDRDDGTINGLSASIARRRAKVMGRTKRSPRNRVTIKRVSDLSVQDRERYAIERVDDAAS